MDITISKLKTGFLVFDKWDADDKHAFSTLDDVIEALPAMFEPAESAAPEIEPVSARGVWIEESGDITPEWYSQRGVPVDGEVPASEANGAADADPA